MVYLGAETKVVTSQFRFIHLKLFVVDVEAW